MNKLTIYLDFDGTVVEHMYPRIGRCNKGWVDVIRKLQNAGHDIIFNTQRIENPNSSFDEAYDFINNKYKKCNIDIIDLDPITKHTNRKIQPTAYDWNLIKQTNELFIDDISFGIPMKKASISHINMVDWKKLDIDFIKNGLY